jgi:hypothetical protein
MQMLLLLLLLSRIWLSFSHVILNTLWYKAFPSNFPTPTPLHCVIEIRMILTCFGQYDINWSERNQEIYESVLVFIFVILFLINCSQDVSGGVFLSCLDPEIKDTWRKPQLSHRDIWHERLNYLVIILWSSMSVYDYDII